MAATAPNVEVDSDAETDIIRRPWVNPRWLRRLRYYPKDRTVSVWTRGEQDFEEKIYALRKAIDRGSFQKLVVLNASLGFFAGAYTIFAMNMAKPMIEIAYYSGRGENGGPQMPTSDEKALRTFIYVGNIIGQIGFGFLADIYGRRTLYGYELTFVVFATLGFTIASTGAGNSVGIIYLLCIFRLLVGIGVGGDYPVSASITSEFAPTGYRDVMLATVFFGQPFGYLVAALVALGVVQNNQQTLDVPINECYEHEDCLRIVDRSWRWVIGVGAILSAIAIGLRRTIPESPLYTAEVLRRPVKATQNIATMGSYQDLVQGQEAQLQIEQDDLPAERAQRVHFVRKKDKAQRFWPRSRKYFRDLNHYVFDKGLWSPVLGTAMAWLLWDMAFYGLGASSHDVVSKIWDTPPETVYDKLYMNAWHSLITVSLGSITGGLVMIYISISPSVSLKRIQIGSFLVLTLLFIVTGLVLRFTAGDYHPLPVVILYVLCEFAFELGPNFTTFMIPAQLFPTTHRALGHGFAAAMGKVGAVVAQSIYEYVTFPPPPGFEERLSQEGSRKNGIAWLGFLILCMIPFMIAGAAVTYFFVPELRSGLERRNMEELAMLTRHPPRQRHSQDSGVELGQIGDHVAGGGAGTEDHPNEGSQNTV